MSCTADTITEVQLRSLRSGALARARVSPDGPDLYRALVLYALADVALADEPSDVRRLARHVCATQINAAEVHPE